jgi:[protein-PII] uridylyltransferase
MSSQPSLKARLLELRGKLEARLPTFDQPAPPPHRGAPAWGLALGRDLVRAYDELLAPIFSASREAAVTLAAVGGYGRGAVALRSDLDVRILARSPSDAERVVDAVLYPLWDAGLSIGHQTLLLSDALDLAREDLSTATSLLDWRYLDGDRQLSDELVWRVSGSLFSTSELARWGARLNDEIGKRHERFGDSVYLLEPDVKNGAGGLRDMDVFRWAAAARYGTGEIDALVRVGALVPREAHELSMAQERLWQIRHLLHAHAGRRSDRLVFEEQEVIAAQLGYGDGPEGVERMMSEYYQLARAINRGVTMMITRATVAADKRRPKDEDLGDGFRLFDGAVTLADTSALEAEPRLALRMLEVAVERGRPLYAYAREAVMRLTADAGWCERLRSDPVAARMFVELVSMRRDTSLDKGSPLREMHELGLLLAMIPEFSPVVGRVHHDVYHVYTVDVHSVAAVDRLAALSRGDLATEHPLASRLAAEVVSPAVLAFATLLHDVGKAIGGKDHSERGAEMARSILARFAFKPEEIDQVARLIQEHLTMYRLATRRDVDDPATVEEMAGVVHARDALRNLFLLTVVDVSTTSPTSMTSWKAHMLDELFIAVDEYLSGGAGEQGRAELLRREIVSFARGYLEGEADAADDLAFLPGFLASMPDRYLVASSAQAILAHAGVVRRHAPPASVEVVPSSHPEAAELCVVADDRPGLLAMIAAALAGSRLEVLAAQIYSRKLADGSVQAVDLFWVQGRVEGVQAAVRSLPKLERDLRALVRGDRAAVDVVGRTQPPRRAGPAVRTRVAVDNRASQEHTVIEVTTLDRPGVLFAISNALFELGLSIAVAKISTEGTRVADVFYVTESTGKKVDPGARAAVIEGALFAALGGESQGHDDVRVKA